MERLQVKDIFKYTLSGCPTELIPFLDCVDCGEPFYLIPAAMLEWSRKYRNTFIDLDLHCECLGTIRPDTEIGRSISFEIGCITIQEQRDRFVKTKPYRTLLKRSKVLINVEFNEWATVREKISNFLQLPLGFED